MKKDYLYLAAIGVLSYIIFKQKQKQKYIIDMCNVALDECYLNTTNIKLPNENL
jgi:hypothetical protein